MISGWNDIWVCGRFFPTTFFRVRFSDVGKWLRRTGSGTCGHFAGSLYHDDARWWLLKPELTFRYFTQLTFLTYPFSYNSMVTLKTHAWWVAHAHLQFSKHIIRLRVLTFFFVVTLSFVFYTSCSWYGVQRVLNPIACFTVKTFQFLLFPHSVLADFPTRPKHRLWRFGPVMSCIKKFGHTKR